MNIQTVLKETEEKMKKSVEVTKRELATIRTGRASPSLVEGITVEYYSNQLPLKQLATISTPEARLIVIQPWDVSMIDEIEKSILKSNLGLTPNNDGKVIRIGIPQLTQERRKELDGLVKKLAEEGRISIRAVRREANHSLKRLEEESKIPEDESYKAQEKTQELTDRYIEEINQLLKNKEKEIMEV